MRKTLLALILAACTALTLPTAASAAPSTGPSVVHPQPGGGGGYVICFRLPSGNWFCIVVVYIVVLPCPCPPEPPCGDCPDVIDFGIGGLPPNEYTQTYNDVFTGMQDLGQATVTTDPGQIAALRTAAMNSFTSAAKLLGSLHLSTPTVGFLDANNQFHSDSGSWRQQAGNHMSAGLTELQQSFSAPNPSSLRAMALANFDAAGKTFAQGAGLGVQG